ncbi:fatty-acid peroxygenase [Salinibacillus aidingensis]|uniref:Fatty-acid peroxygenase n=1 Tax=Salinibacillus aidingensis TaxID=237684 RepID=A0ABN1ALZ8_9BACI
MRYNEEIPHEEGMDHSIALLQEGYLFIKNRADQFKTDLFETRVLGKKVVCMTGPEAAKIFYDLDRFQRKWAAPYRIQQSLFGVGAIQGMDGQAHHQRKQQFLSLMDKRNQERLAEMVTNELKHSIPQWEKEEQVRFFKEIKNVLCWVACQWAGVPVKEEDIPDLADDLISMVYAFGRVGPEHWKGRTARNRTEGWMENIIEDVRSGNIPADESSALYVMAFLKDEKGQHLPAKKAAIELINVLRPIVAISTYITFAAVALHEHPKTKEPLKEHNSRNLEMFVNEVRRFYPFGPFLGARVKEDFTWNNYTFKRGTLVLLDIYGMHHDERFWETPNQFDPNNFKNQDRNDYSFIPQGGSDPGKGHRCPGEGITVEVMKATVDFLVNKMDYDVPAQDFNYSLDEMPTLPKSGFLMTNVKRI